MKWSSVAVVGVGLVTVACATVLMGTFRAKGRSSAGGATTREVEMVDVVVAAKPLKAISLVHVDSIRTEKVPKGQVPEGAIHSAVHVVGRVVKRPMVEGQPFVESCLVKDGTGDPPGPPGTPASVPPGMRVVSIPVPRDGAPYSLLYPGCKVDVLATFDVDDGKRPEGVISRALMENVTVLAIGDHPIASEPNKDVKPGELPRSRHGRPLTVFLLVTPAQAQELQAAMEYGSVSLALRPPPG